MSVQKVGNGGTIVVRTGVLSGLGPQGPKGAKGDVGPAGPIGNEGPTGPAGAISELLSVAKLTVPQTIGPAGTTLLSFETVERDDHSIFNSSTGAISQDVGAIYQMNAWIQIDKPANNGNGQRRFWFLEDGPSDEILAIASCEATVLDKTHLVVSTTFEAKANCIYRLYGYSNDDLSVSVSAGRLTYNRIGAGPPGPAGPIGPDGAVGPIGPEGAVGPPGSATDGFDSFEDLRAP